MKKILVLLSIILASITLKAEVVTTEIGLVTATEITATFTPTSSCDSFAVLCALQEEMDMYVQWLGVQLSVLVHEWGIVSTTVLTHTFDDLVPGQEYTIYVLPFESNFEDDLETMVVTTLSTGGTGDAIISISVSEITSMSAKVVCTPNDQTALFKNMLITQAYYNEIGQDSAINLLKDDFYTFYSEDENVWNELQGNTIYYAIAIGKNADGVWGQLAIEQFATLPAGESHVSIAVSDITQNSARIEFTPNSETVKYYVGVFPEAEVLENGAENFIDRIISDDNYAFYSAGFNATSLEANTSYCAMAVGINSEDARSLTVETFTTLAPTFIDDSEMEFAVYPTVGNGQFILKSSNFGSSAVVYDMLGKIVTSTKITSRETYFDINVANGMYIINVVSENGDVEGT